MTRAFEPRPVGTGAWKVWHRDAVHLVGRMGVLPIVLWCALLPALALGLYRWAGQGGSYLTVLLLMQALGVLVQPLMQRALDQAASGQPIHWERVAKLAGGDLRGAPGWFVERVVFQFLATFTYLGVFAALLFLGPAPDSSVASGPSNPLNPVANLLIFAIVSPAACRRHGFLDCSYWLRVRHGIGRAHASRLHEQSASMNARNKLCSTAVLLLAYCAAVVYVPAALVALPMLHWYHAAVARCAYHDIFEGGTGLKAMVPRTTEAARGAAIHA